MHYKYIFDHLFILVNNCTDLSYEERTATLNIFDELWKLNHKYDLLENYHLESFFSIHNIFNIMNNYESKLIQTLSKGEGFNKEVHLCSDDYYKWFQNIFLTLNECFYFLIKILKTNNLKLKDDNCYNENIKHVFKGYSFNIYLDGLVSEENNYFYFDRHFFKMGTFDQNNEQYQIKDESILNNISHLELNENEIKIIFMNNKNLLNNIGCKEFKSLFFSGFEILKNKDLDKLEFHKKIDMITLLHSL